MLIKMLVENEALSPAFQERHGLSVYLETGSRRILFDMGPDGLFLENAVPLGVDIGEVELAVVSHGHYDHGGGLAAFLERNRKAKVYLHREAFGEQLARRPGGDAYIGLDKSLLDHPRVILTGGRQVIQPGLELFTLPEGHTRYFPSRTNEVLFRREGERDAPDNFRHEQSLLVTEEGRRWLFAGCAHSGIVDILEEAERVGGGPVHYLVGGFHLKNVSDGWSEPDETILGIAERLAGKGVMCYTCHCTGREAFEKMKEILGDRLQYLPAGGVVRG